MSQNRPMVTLKIAISNDGMIAEGEGIRTAITGQDTNLFTQKLRAKYDAILVGIGTVLADDPSLTCRIEGQEHLSPVRIVLDRTLKIPPKSALMKGAKKVPLWIISEETELPRHLTKKGVELISMGNYQILALALNSISEELENDLYDDPYQIGWMAVTVNLSNLAAVGAMPRVRHSTSALVIEYRSLACHAAAIPLAIRWARI